MDDLVIDVSTFIDSHPGGKYLLQHNIGRDISKFFYGGYTLNRAFTPFNHHSKKIYALLNSLKVGRLTINTNPTP